MRTMYIFRTDDRPTDDLTFWKNSNGHISGTGRPIHFMFGSTVGFSRVADRMDLLPVGPNPRWRLTSHFGKFQTAISVQRIIRSTSCLILGLDFRERRIEWIYFRLDQIEDGGWPPSWKISNDHYLWNELSDPLS